MRFKNVLEIDVGRCLRALVKKWSVIVGITVLFALIGIGLTLQEDPDQYSSFATVYSVSEGSFQASMTGTSAMNAYLDICSSYKVCDRAALMMGNPDIDGEEVMNSVYVNLVDSSSNGATSMLSSTNAAIIRITATTTSPQLSQEMAKAVADAFVLEMQSIVGSDIVKLLDSPYDSQLTFSGSNHNWKLRIMAMLAGFVLSCLMVVFFEVFDSKVRTIREGSIRNELPVIGVIPELKK